MLILTRRTGESLIIGDEVTVTVLGIKGGQVRLGIEAPRDIAIHREEVAERDAAAKAEQDGQAAAEEPEKEAETDQKWMFRVGSSDN